MVKKSSRKFLFIDEYYLVFLKHFWEGHPELTKKSYKIQRRTLLADRFGTSDFYSYNLKKLGYIAEDIIVNDEVSQKQWAREHGIETTSSKFISKLQLLPYLYKFIGRPKWIQQIAIAQIKLYKPDVVYVQNISILNPNTLKQIKRFCKLLVGQLATDLPNIENIKVFDLILSSLPHYVTLFRNMGIKSEYLKLAFEARIFKKIGKIPKRYGVSFIGSFSPRHSEGIRLLEYAAKRLPLKVWGYGIGYLSPVSPLRKVYQGQAWGLEMYRILAKSRIVINRHINIARNNANNMRLYETTGMGTLLITDKKENLNQLFNIGQDAVAYTSPQDLVDKVRFYLQNDKEREKIAKAGQKRTLSEHTYEKRMKEMVAIIERYLK